MCLRNTGIEISPQMTTMRHGCGRRKADCARGAAFSDESGDPADCFIGHFLRRKAEIQSGSHEDQHGCAQENDSAIATQPEGSRSAGKHESARDIDA
jgi:hypothetical protein